MIPVPTRRTEAVPFHEVACAEWSLRGFESDLPELNLRLTGNDLAYLRDASGRPDLKSPICGSQGTLLADGCSCRSRAEFVDMAERAAAGPR